MRLVVIFNRNVKKFCHRPVERGVSLFYIFKCIKHLYWFVIAF